MFIERILDRISQGIYGNAVKYQDMEKARLGRVLAEVEFLQRMADLRERMAENRVLRERSLVAA